MRAATSACWREKAESHRRKSSEVALAASTKVDDLEAVHTPESMMLSTMTKESDAERTDREVLVPWIKFLWDSLAQFQRQSETRAFTV